MAKKPHKYAGSHLAATTTVAPERVAEITKSVAEATKKVRFEGAGTGRTHFSIRHLGGRVEWMTFDVAITAHEGGSKVRTGIGRYLTTQSKVAGFIPVSPKEMLGYKIYRAYLHALAASLTAEDASTHAQVTELTV